VDAIRTLLPEGFNQLLIASTEKYTRKAGFLEYINRSHGWLTKKVIIKLLYKKAMTRMDVLQLVKMNIIQESVFEASAESNENVMERLEKALNSGDVLFTVEELFYAIRDEAVPEFILVTEKFDNSWRGNRRYQSMIQRVKNMRATFSIVKCDAPASARLEQLGGFVSVIRR
jgi:stalled ribosome rescue protein Dom34